MRLAERRGLLTGVSISRVQALALEMLLMIDNREKVKSFVDTLRSMIVGANPTSMREMFPEWFTPESLALKDDGTYDPDLLESALPASPTPDLDEVESLDDWIASRTAGTISADELEKGGDYQWH